MNEFGKETELMNEILVLIWIYGKRKKQYLIYKISNNRNLVKST